MFQNRFAQTRNLTKGGRARAAKWFLPAVCVCLLAGPTLAGAASSSRVEGDQTVTGSQTVSTNQGVSGYQTVGSYQTVTGNQTVGGNNTVSGTQTVSGALTASTGVNVGSATSAGNGQVKLKSTTASPNMAWHSYYSTSSSGSVGLSLGGSTEDPNGAWTDESEALSETSGYAYTSTKGSTYNLKVYNFGFSSIPGGATITGVEVLYRIMGDGIGGEASADENYKALCVMPDDVYFNLLNANRAVMGTAKSVVFGANADTWTSNTLGSSQDTWSASITQAIATDSDFGVCVWMLHGTYLDVDYVKIKVYYSTSSLTEGQWMAGSYRTDGSWRLVKNQTDLNSNVMLGINSSGNLGIGTTGHATYPLYLSNGAYCSTGGTWTNNSSRSHKLNIAPVPVASAWELLDQLLPVDFEYRKTEKQFKLQDGSLVRERPADPDQVAEEVTVWTDQGSGEKHRGFIAEEMPAPLLQGEGVSALDIAANNTAALKEAKRRILELETAMAALKVGVVGGSGGAAGLAGIAGLLEGTPSDETIRRLTESVLEKLGVEPWVEIPFAEAWAEVDETTPVSSKQTVMRYRANLETLQVEPYTVEETVTQQQATGRKVKQLKPDVRFDEKTGKFYRWCGLGGSTPQETAAALSKILPGPGAPDAAWATLGKRLAASLATKASVGVPAAPEK